MELLLLLPPPPPSFPSGWGGIRQSCSLNQWEKIIHFNAVSEKPRKYWCYAVSAWRMPYLSAMFSRCSPPPPPPPPVFPPPFFPSKADIIGGGGGGGGGFFFRRLPLLEGVAGLVIFAFFIFSLKEREEEGDDDSFSFSLLPSGKEQRRGENIFSPHSRSFPSLCHTPCTGAIARGIEMKLEGAASGDASFDKREKISSCRRCWQERNQGARGTNMSVNFLKTVHRRVGLFLVHHSSAFNLIICSNQDMLGTWQQASHHKYDVQYSSRKNISLPFFFGSQSWRVISIITV